MYTDNIVETGQKKNNKIKVVQLQLRSAHC